MKQGLISRTAPPFRLDEPFAIVGADDANAVLLSFRSNAIDDRLPHVMRVDVEREGLRLGNGGHEAP